MTSLIDSTIFANRKTKTFVNIYACTKLYDVDLNNELKVLILLYMYIDALECGMYLNATD